MAKTKQDKKLYSRMRAGGVRKKTARQLAELPAHVSGGTRAPKALRDAVDRLEATVKELKEHSRQGDRRAAARKAARTRQAQAKRRSAAARTGARSRTRA